MGMVKGQGQLIGPLSNRFASVRVHVNQTNKSRDTAISTFDLEKPKVKGQGHMLYGLYCSGHISNIMIRCHIGVTDIWCSDKLWRKPAGINVIAGTLAQNLQDIVANEIAVVTGWGPLTAADDRQQIKKSMFKTTGA